MHGEPSTVDAFLTTRGRERRALLRAGALSGVLAAAGRFFSSVARADPLRASASALLNTIDFLSRRAGLSRLDASALASVAVSFRVTQVVDVNKGAHAMIPKSIFAAARARALKVV